MLTAGGAGATPVRRMGQIVGPIQTATRGLASTVTLIGTLAEFNHARAHVTARTTLISTATVLAGASGIGTRVQLLPLNPSNTAGGHPLSRVHTTGGGHPLSPPAEEGTAGPIRTATRGKASTVTLTRTPAGFKRAGARATALITRISTATVLVNASGIGTWVQLLPLNPSNTAGGHPLSRVHTTGGGHPLSRVHTTGGGHPLSRVHTTGGSQRLNQRARL